MRYYSIILVILAAFNTAAPARAEFAHSLFFDNDTNKRLFVAWALRTVPERDNTPVFEPPPPPEPTFNEQITLKALFYYAPNKWSAWLNIGNVSAEAPTLGNYRVKGISARAISLTLVNNPQKTITLRPGQSYLPDSAMIVEQPVLSRLQPEESDSEKPVIRTTAQPSQQLKRQPTTAPTTPAGKNKKALESLGINLNDLLKSLTNKN